MVDLSVCAEMVYDDDPFAERIHRAADAGVDAVEFWGWREKDLDAISTVADEAGIEIVGCVAGGELTDPQRTDEAVETIRESIRMAADRGIGTLIATTGPDQEGLDRQSQHETVPDSLESAVVYDGQQYDCRVWNEWLSPIADRTAVVGQYEGDLADGEAAIVHSEVGEGSVIYVGTWPGEDLAGALVGDLLDRAGVETTDPLPAQVRFVRRDGLTWIANFRTESLTVDAPAGATWLVGDAAVGSYDVAVTDATPGDLSVRES